MALHFLLMEGVYKLSASEQTPIKKQQKISIKIAKPPEIPKDIVKIQNPKKAATELAPRKPVKQAPSEPPKSRQTVTPKNKEKHITAADLEKKGMKLVDKALNGSFPGIVFSYGDPIALFSKCIALAAKQYSMTTETGSIQISACLMAILCQSAEASFPDTPR